MGFPGDSGEGYRRVDERAGRESKLKTPQRALPCPSQGRPPQGNPRLPESTAREDNASQLRGHTPKKGNRTQGTVKRSRIQDGHHQGKPKKERRLGGVEGPRGEGEARYSIQLGTVGT